MSRRRSIDFSSNGGPKSFFPQRCISLWVCLLFPILALGSDREHQVKAGFIFNFAKFCEWDQSRSGDRFIVGVFRTEAFGHSLDVLAGKTISGKPISVEKLRSEDEVKRCNIAVIGDLSQEELQHLIRECKGTGTLLIGESTGFADKGGTIGFAVKEGTVRFDVNLVSARMDGVQISSKLLGLAEEVIR